MEGSFLSILRIAYFLAGLLSASLVLYFCFSAFALLLPGFLLFRFSALSFCTFPLLCFSFLPCYFPAFPFLRSLSFLQLSVLYYFLVSTPSFGLMVDLLRCIDFWVCPTFYLVHFTNQALFLVISSASCVLSIACI